MGRGEKGGIGGGRIRVGGVALNASVRVKVSEVHASATVTGR